MLTLMSVYFITILTVIAIASYLTVMSYTYNYVHGYTSTAHTNHNTNHEQDI